MSAPSLKPLLQAAARLKQANYGGYEEFLVALKLRVEEHKTAAVFAPSETVQAMQGRAQEALHLYKILSEATQRVEAMTGKDLNTNERLPPTGNWP